MDVICKHDKDNILGKYIYFIREDVNPVMQSNKIYTETEEAKYVGFEKLYFYHKDKFEKETTHIIRIHSNPNFYEELMIKETNNKIN